MTISSFLMKKLQTMRMFLLPILLLKIPEVKLTAQYEICSRCDVECRMEKMENC